MAPRVKRIAPSLVLAFIAAACGGDEAGDPAATSALRFRDVTRASGIELVAPPPPARQILDVKGGGVGLVDVDGDGLLDIFVPGRGTLEEPYEGSPARLYKNLGNLRFADATAELGPELRRWGQGVTVGDVDGDGRDDVFVACFGPDALLRNRGGRLVLDENAGDFGDAWSTSAAFGDLDGDGDLDLYVTRYLVFDPSQPPPPMRFLGAEVFAGPMGLEAASDAVYENLGDGTFRDVTEVWGFNAPAPSYGLGVVIVDFDGDGRNEVLVGNDSAANFLFRRSSDDATRYEEIGIASGVALSGEGAGQATMGIALADVDGDGLADVFSTNFMADTNTLHVQRPALTSEGLTFVDRTSAYGLGLESRPFLGWGTVFADFDHDGDEDLVLVNGHVYPDAVCVPQGWRRLQEPLLFERNGERFQRVTAERGGAWLADARQDRGLAAADLDRDGDVDLVVTERGGALRVIENVGADGAWLVVELADNRAGAMNRRGIGARVEIVDDSGARQLRWIVSGLSYQSSSWFAAHFGLGDATGPWTLNVRWPDGVEQSIAIDAARKYVTVERDA